MKESPSVCACVLAAGASARMGACKLLMPFDGSTLLARALEAASRCAAQQTVAVTGAHRDEVVSAVARFGAKEVPNPLWKQGQATSVKAAVRYAASAGFDAVLLMVADQPFVTSSHLNTLLCEYDDGETWAYLSATENRNGNPCLFDRRCFQALLELEGDEGARTLFRRNPGFPARYVYFDDADLFEDADTPQDLVRLETLAQSRRKGAPYA